MLFINPTGHHQAAWRHPRAQADAGVNLAHYVQLAQTAERARFDAVFLADNQSVRVGDPACVSRTAQYVANFEPLTQVAYARAAEFVDVCKGLWDSWEDDAFPRDVESGIFSALDKLHTLDHVGESFRCAGPLNVPRSPQGHPLFVQAGSLPTVDLTRYDLDAPLPDTDPGGRSYGEWAEIGRREGLTLGELARRASGSLAGMSVRGSGAEIPDVMQEWVEAGACDGFNLQPAFLPGGLDDFVEFVLPELRRRGLVRTAYDTTTLRGHFGLDRMPWQGTRAAATPVAAG